jgi:hypothetical protein
MAAMNKGLMDFLRPRHRGPSAALVIPVLHRLKEVGGDPNKLTLEDQDILIEADGAGHFGPPHTKE